MEDLSEKSETLQWRSGYKEDTFLLRVAVSSLGSALPPLVLQTRTESTSLFEYFFN